MSQGRHVTRSAFSHNMCLLMWQIVVVNISVKACFDNLTNKHHNKGLTQIVCQILGWVRFLNFFDFPIPFHSFATFMMTL